MNSVNQFLEILPLEEQEKKREEVTFMFKQIMKEKGVEAVEADAAKGEGKQQK